MVEHLPAILGFIFNTTKKKEERLSSDYHLDLYQVLCRDTATTSLQRPVPILQMKNLRFSES